MRRSITFWICSSAAPSCITTTMIQPLLLLFPFNSFDATAFIDYPFEQPLQALIIQRAAIHCFDTPENLALSFRIVDPKIFDMFNLSDLNCTFRALIEEFNKFGVDLINFAPPIFDAHLD